MLCILHYYMLQNKNGQMIHQPLIQPLNNIIMQYFVTLYILTKNCTQRVKLLIQLSAMQILHVGTNNFIENLL